MAATGRPSGDNTWRCAVSSMRFYRSSKETDSTSSDASSRLKYRLICSAPSAAWEDGMSSAIGLAMVVPAAGLVYLGRPDRKGRHPRLLQFGAALVPYPPVVLVVLAFGVAELLDALSWALYRS
jgi:hypothetical protein